MTSEYSKKQFTLTYPQHLLKPEDLLHFLEDAGFTLDWKELGLTDDDLLALQVMIMAGGKNAPVVRGTGGLRKLRFAPLSWQMGKSGAARVGFVYFPDYWTIYFIIAYSKGEMDNISPAGKKVIRRLIKEAEAELKRIKLLKRPRNQT